MSKSNTSRLTMTATLASGVAGTMNYMAPESLKNAVCPRSDIFSAGLVLYDMFFGEERPDLVDVLNKVSIGLKFFVKFSTCLTYIPVYFHRVKCKLLIILLRS